MLSPPRLRSLLPIAVVLSTSSACNSDLQGGLLALDLAASADAGLVFAEPDLYFDLSPEPARPDPCGDSTMDLSCIDTSIGASAGGFLLMNDTQQPDPKERDQGLQRDASGYLVLNGALTGSYSLVLRGCTDTSGDPTNFVWWFQLAWDGDAPPGTQIVLRAKSGVAADRTDPSWAANHFTPGATVAPVDLQQSLVPNVTVANQNQDIHDGYLLVEAILSSNSPNVTPRLKSIDVGFKCCVACGS